MNLHDSERCPGFLHTISLLPHANVVLIIIAVATAIFGEPKRGNLDWNIIRERTKKFVNYDSIIQSLDTAYYEKHHAMESFQNYNFTWAKKNIGTYPGKHIPATADKNGIYWQTDHERGDLADWEIGEKDRYIFNNKPAAVTVTKEASHSGRFAMKMQIWGGDTGKPACRIFRYAEWLTEGYFSLWVMLPEIPDIGSGWIIFYQFKKRNAFLNSDPVWYLEIKQDKKGNTGFCPTNWHEECCVYPTSGEYYPIIKAGTWYHVETYYKDGIDNGEFSVWIDDKKYWEFKNINTRGPSREIFWAPSLYVQNLNSPSVILYFDDAVISDRRVGKTHTIKKSAGKSSKRKR